MTKTSITFTPARGLLASMLFFATCGHTLAEDQSSMSGSEKAPATQTVSFNGYSCDHVRAKVAESGITAAYAYARYMGMTSRDIARVRKACSV